MRLKYLNQRGAAALISVSVVSLLVLVLTVAMSSLMVGEFRQSIDTENGTKAYYTALSGTEEAYAELANAGGVVSNLLALNQDCTAPSASYQAFIPDASGAPGVGLTCRIVQTQSSDVIGEVDQDKTTQFNVNNLQLGHVAMTWDDPSRSAGTSGWSNGNINGASWPSNAPPPFVFTLASYQRDNSPGTDIRSLIVVPCNTNFGGCDSATADFSNRNSFDISDPTQSVAARPTIVVKAPCQPTTATKDVDRCQIDISNLLTNSANTAAVVRIRPLFRDMNYDMKFYDSGGTLQTVALPSANIDVTARSGDSFRRLTTSVQIQSQPSSAADNVLFSDNSICKDFTVFGDPNGAYSFIGVGGTCALSNSVVSQ